MTRSRTDDETKPIEKPKLILAEGADAYYFLIWAYQRFGAEEIEVRDFGGNQQLSDRLEAFRVTKGFSNVESLIVARDAEAKDGKGDAAAAMKSVRNALGEAGLPVPEEAFSFTSEKPRTAIMLFPGYLSDKDGAQLENGTLEDLCLGTIGASDPVLPCVQRYLACLEEAGAMPRNERKARLHAYVAGKDKLAGMKLGEATQAGAWDLEHASVMPFKKLILQM